MVTGHARTAMLVWYARRVTGQVQRDQAQRRPMTVLLCDLVGSAALAAGTDPEDARDLVGAYLNLCAAVVGEMGGFVARFTGDGVLAYFGYPIAREGDAERAVRAAVAIARRAAGLRRPDGLPAASRAGVATGLVVVGPMLRAGAVEEHAAFGEAPNLAARLQAEAEPDGVLVCPRTRALVGGAFGFVEVPPLTLKGFEGSRRAWRVSRPAEARSRAGAEVLAEAPPLVGRDRELAALLAAWVRTGEGRGESVGIIGDAGMGKTSLLAEARRRIGDEAAMWLEARATAMFSGAPLHPLTEMLERRGVADQFGADGGGPSLEVEARRERVLERMTARLLRAVDDRPAVIVIEDLHWADPSTLEVVRRLAGRIKDRPTLLLWTARREAGGALDMEAATEIVALTPLAPADVRRLALGFSPGLTAEMLATVVGRSGGAPLFAIELARYLVERIGAKHIPDTLSELLTARLDRLGPARGAAQAAAVLGTTFTDAHFAIVMNKDTTTVQGDLAALTADGLLTRSEDRLAFSHVLLQEAAYDSLLRGERRRLHARAAQAWAGDLDGPGDLAVIAHHWTEAGAWDQALDAWSRAAEAATRLGHHGEAEQALRRAESVLEAAGSPALTERYAGPIATGSADVLQFTHGFSAAETRTAHQPATRLTSVSDQRPAAAEVARAWTIASSAGDHEAALPLARRLWRAAEAGGRPSALCFARLALITSLTRVGELLECEAVFRQGEPLFREEAFWRSPGAAPQVFGNAAINAWLIGDSGEAGRRARLCLDLSARTGDPFTIAFGSYMGSLLAMLGGRRHRAEALATAALTVAEQRGFPQFTATSRIVLGRARAKGVGREAGAALIVDGLAAMRAARTATGQTLYLIWLAEIRLALKQRDLALAAAEDALHANPAEKFFRPEALRLRSGLRLQSGDEAGGVEDLLEAERLASRMGARRLWERVNADIGRRGALPRKRAA